MTTNLPAIIELPEPPVPPDCDCRDLDGFMLNVERLMASELVALSIHETVCAALYLWCRAWKQVPAASLPDDDRVNAAFAKLTLKRYLHFKDQILRGFVKCRDGRLYHRVLAAEALVAWKRKKSFRERREKDAERLRRWRANQDETPNETRFETRSERSGQGQGQGHKKEERKDSLRESKRKRSASLALPADWEPDRDFARGKGFTEAQIDEQALRFRDHAAANNRKQADWQASWRNWITSPYQRTGPPNGVNGHPSLKDQRRQECNDVIRALEESIDRDNRKASSQDPAELFPASRRG